MTFASETGDVAIDNETGYGGLVFTKQYTATDLTLASAASSAATRILTARSTATDFITLAGNFSDTGANWLAGDFNGDGVVNALDFNIFATNFGKSGSTAGGGVGGGAARGTAPGAGDGSGSLFWLRLHAGRRRRNCRRASFRGL